MRPTEATSSQLTRSKTHLAAAGRHNPGTHNPDARTHTQASCATISRARHRRCFCSQCVRLHLCDTLSIKNNVGRLTHTLTLSALGAEPHGEEGLLWRMWPFPTEPQNELLIFSLRPVRAACRTPC